MANLITEKQKKTIRLDYIIRLFALSFLVISLLGIFFLAYLIPYYLSVREKDIITAEQFKSVISAENKENVGESASRVVTQTMDELRAVELYGQDPMIPSAYFDKIIENKSSGIQITKLALSIVKKGQVQILVSGISKNRESLVTYIEDLKSKAGFASVESPVSDFARDSDISFTLNIKTAI